MNGPATTMIHDLFDRSVIVRHPAHLARAVALAEAARLASGRASLQGNLDPADLARPREEIFARVSEMAEQARTARGWIANLGHGCTPETPVAGVRAFTDAVRALGA